MKENLVNTQQRHNEAMKIAKEHDLFEVQ